MKQQKKNLRMVLKMTTSQLLELLNARLKEEMVDGAYSPETDAMDEELRKRVPDMETFSYLNELHFGMAKVA